MNKADNDASTRAIDSLINYEVSFSVINANALIDYIVVVLFSLCGVDIFFFFFNCFTDCQIFQ